MPDYPDNWNEIREKVLRRDNYRCCNEPSHNKKLHIHHIVPLSKGGTHNLNNLITLCEDCHKRIHPHLEVNFKGDRKEGEERIICDSDILEIDISTDFEIRDIALNNLISRIEESTIDVREKLQNYNGEVDEFQKKVVEAEESVIRVLAPAGSGKTQTIINRVISNIRRGLNPNNILVLTFDNSAVNSLQEKLSGVLSNLVINFQLEIKTLNAFGFSLLDYYFPEEHKNIIPDFRQKKLFEEVKKGLHEISQEIYSALPRSIYYSYYIELFSLLKNEIIDPRDPENQKIVDIMLSRNEFIPLFPNPDDRNIVRKTIQAVIWLYQAYDKVMQNENLMDFDDQKLRSYILLCQNIEILNNVQSKYKEIIVDEFQDINQLDFKFIKLISNQSRLVITGDDDQAIYGFRGCSPKFILELQNMLGRQVTTYRLQKNYRSPQNIVMYSTNLIRHNTRREEKDPIPAKTGVAEIKIVSSISSGLEAKLIVGYLKRVKRENQISYKDCVVLYRTNAQSLTLQVEFILNNIPYYVREEDNILGNETLEKLLGFLRMKLAIKSGKAPSIMDSVLSLKSYFQYISAQQENQLYNLFSKHPDILQTISMEDFYQILEKARRSRISERFQEAIHADSLLDTLDVLKNFNGLRGMIGSLEDVLSEQVPLGEIYEIAANFKGNIKEFVEMLDSAMEQARSIRIGHDIDNGVGLLTYFRSKGQQWHTVVLTTCNDGIIPHRRANIEDERRLFYVAMTRAESNLLISYVYNVCGSIVEPSRFIREAGL